MARPINRLSARAVQTLTKQGYHADGGGLYLLVKPTGSKSWVLRFRRGGRLREMGLGSTQVVSLQEARAAALEHHKHLAGGEDPIDARRAARSPEASFGQAEGAQGPPSARLRRLTSTRTALAGRTTPRPTSGYSRSGTTAHPNRCRSHRSTPP